MFGYIVPNQAALTDEQKTRYRGFYCGLCHALGEQFGKRGRATLSYDLTFFAILLSSLYEPEENSAPCRCLLKPKEKHNYLSGEVFSYCADMNLLLAYYHLLDDWKDEHSVKARTEAQLLKPRVEQVEMKHPEKSKCIREALTQLDDAERFASREIDRVSSLTGRILIEVALWREDRWAPTLRRLSDSLGRFVYLMDAWEDYHEDCRKQRYNPLIAIAEGKDFDERCRAILTMLISECTDAFETLPLVQDVDILRNILYSGVWARHAAKHADRKENLIGEDAGK